MYQVERKDEDIAHLEARTLKTFETGEPHYPGMTYEDGVRETLDWLLGRIENSPADD